MATVVRLRRREGKLLTPYDVYIGRAIKRGGWDLPSSYWANPFQVKIWGREGALAKYEEHVRHPARMARLPELRGKRLGCWCAPAPCHGDVLVRLLVELDGAAASPAAEGPAEGAARGPAQRDPVVGELKAGEPCAALAETKGPDLEGLLAGYAGSVEAWFDALALALLQASRLAVAGRAYRILEVEMYLHRPGHEDSTVHRHSAQRDTVGCWYFHREAAARIGFTLKGVDLTFGAKGVEFGGILVRAIQAEAETVGIDGPSKVVDEILRRSGVETVRALRALPTFRDSAFADGLVRLEARPPEPCEIRVGPRVGLKSSHAYAQAPYRYRARAGLAAKDKKGLARGRALWGPTLLEDSDFEAIGF
jgi:hypothetical protein